MNLLFFLTPKQEVRFVYEDFTLRQTLEKWSNQRFATIPVLRRNGEYMGTISEGDILWGIKNLHGLDLDSSEDVPISSFPRRRDYKAVPVTTDMRALLHAAIDQNFVPVVDDRNVFIGMVRRTVILRHFTEQYELAAEGNAKLAMSKARRAAAPPRLIHSPDCGACPYRHAPFFGKVFNKKRRNQWKTFTKNCLVTKSWVSA